MWPLSLGVFNFYISSQIHFLFFKKTGQKFRASEPQVPLKKVFFSLKLAQPQVFCYSNTNHTKKGSLASSEATVYFSQWQSGKCNLKFSVLRGWGRLRLYQQPVTETAS